MPAKKNLITSANAREMQKKGAEKRKENAEKRKTAALIAQEVLDRIIKSKVGESKSVREILVEVILGKSINEKDLSAQATALLKGGVFKKTHVRDIQVFEYYEEKVKEESRMWARFHTAAISTSARSV